MTLLYVTLTSLKADKKFDTYLVQELLDRVNYSPVILKLNQVKTESILWPNRMKIIYDLTGLNILESYCIAF